MLKCYNDFIDMIIELSFMPWRNWLIVFIFLVGLTILIKVIILYRRLRLKQNTSWLDRETIKKEWQKIESLLETGQGANYKLAILEADKLLDEVLKQMGFGGSSLAERLKLASAKFTRLRQVWPAHKIRNLLVHEVNYHLNFSEAKRSIKIFKKCLRELGAL